MSPNSLRHQARHNDSLSFNDLVNTASTLLTDNGSFEVLLPTSELTRFLAIAKVQGLIITHTTHIQPTPTKPVHREIIKLRKIKLQKSGLNNQIATESLIVIKDQTANTHNHSETAGSYYSSFNRPKSHKDCLIVLALKSGFYNCFKNDVFLTFF